MSINQNQNKTAASYHGEILRQIYRVWLIRKFLPVFAVEIIIFTVVLYKLGQVVFIERVAENALRIFFQNPPLIFSFFAAAFGHAPLGTKFLITGIAIITAFLIRHLTQGILRFILVRKNYFAKVPANNN